jgi:peptidyl-tRNA hydrolase, PTH1 family
MKLIVGLGNPGPEYRDTRHNMGFMAVDALLERLDFVTTISSNKFQAQAWELVRGDQKLIIAKPTTYMNHSGDAVGAIVRFYKAAAEDVWIIHDELDLPIGTIRTKQGRGDAGHNGLGSITSVIGPDYWRIRLGIANELLRHPIPSIDFVLQKFTPEELATARSTAVRASELVLSYLDDGIRADTLGAA